MEGFRKQRKISHESQKILGIFSLGSVSIMTMALLLNFSPFIDSTALRDRTGHLARSVSSEGAEPPTGKDLMDYKNDDAYPFVVLKRAALIFDRILKGLQSASENNPFVNDWSPVTRRGNSKDKLYFRCYFNAVSCYKKK